jgi:hypothetical protein
LLHDAARLGAHDDVAAPLLELAAAADSPLVAVRAEHAAALCADDGERLEVVADRFAQLGTALLAAEAAAARAPALLR